MLFFRYIMKGWKAVAGGITYYIEAEEEFYHVLGKFTDQQLADKMKMARRELEQFESYICREKVEPLRSSAEYALEMLAIGVYMNHYLTNSYAMKQYQKNICIYINQLREHANLLRTFFSKGKGICSAWCMQTSVVSAKRHLWTDFVKLRQWLLATGEYQEELFRIENWNCFLKDRLVQERNRILSICKNMASGFEKDAQSVLGHYVQNVERFRNTVQKTYKWREDCIMCNKPETEYYLNMAGAHILSRVFETEFAQTEQKYIFVPACMSKKEQGCQAVKDGEGYRCQKCSPDCSVCKTVMIAEKYGAETVIVHHGSAINRMKAGEDGKKGVIGIACVVNLLSGGWKAKRLGYVPQCVFLNYCGCNHWCQERVMTEIDLKRLERILCQ